MPDRSDLHEEAIVGALRDRYGIEARLARARSRRRGPVGMGVPNRDRSGKAAYFVKVREANGSRDVAAAVSEHLRESGLQHVVAPIRSSTSSLTVEDGELSFTVYPLVEGRTGVEAGLDRRHWVELGSEISRLHSSALPSDLSAQVAIETYRPAEHRRHPPDRPRRLRSKLRRVASPRRSRRSGPLIAPRSSRSSSGPRSSANW